MAKIHGEVDTLQILKYALKERHILNLNTLDEILSFKDQSEKRLKEIEERTRKKFDENILSNKKKITISSDEYNALIREQKVKIEGEIGILTDRVSTARFFNKLIFWLKRKYYKINFEQIARRPYKKLARNLKKEQRKVFKLEKDKKKIIDKEISELASLELTAKKILSEYNEFLYGAIGEEKVLFELKKLPDTFHVINNFQMRFNKPLYNKKFQNRIYSVQADHIVVGPSGVFLIETKNWSKKTLRNSSEYSPIDQIRRTSFALYCHLNPKPLRGIYGLLFNRSKSQKVSIRNIIVMVGGARIEKNEAFIKTLSPSELNRYILYFKPIYSDHEVEKLVRKLT